MSAGGRAARSGAAGAAVAVLAALVFARPAASLEPVPGPATCPAATDAGGFPSAAADWPAPLARRVSLHLGEASLREALDGLAAAAGLRLSYSADLLPLDRKSCVSFDSVPVGDALAGLLRGTRLEAVVAGADHVVLAPVSAPAASVAAATSPTVYVLDGVVVRGKSATDPSRPLAAAVDVIDGRELERRQASTLSQAFDGAVPGVWMWQQSPVSLLARYGSVRGASSFGPSYPKIYIDGIEVANPLLLTRLSPESIERVEVIRGPQGAALYGADAINGVTNIVMRHDAPEPGTPTARLQTRFGFGGSDFTPRSTLSQDHALTVSAGSSRRSAALNVDFGSVGEFIPGAYSRHVMASGGARAAGSHSVFTGTLRFFSERAGTAASPILADSVPASLGMATAAGAHAAPGAQSVTEYTLGLSASFTPTDRWTHTFVAGVDGYTLGGALADVEPVPSPSDSALLAARGGADRATFRITSVGRYDLGARASATLTFAAEQSILRQRTLAPGVADVLQSGGAAAGLIHPGTSGLPADSGSAYVDWRSNTGLTAQANATLLDRIFLSAGARLERGEDPSGFSRFATLPMLGAAWLAERGPVALKLRVAYGKGIRWPQASGRQAGWDTFRALLERAYLAPEEQAGIETGFDLTAGRALRLAVTRFDQTASGLIQRVGTADLAALRPIDGVRHIDYEFQNVGQIRNRGWELQGSLEHGPLSLAASLALVDSRVQRLADGYSGDLRPGDRMLEVPARTMSLTAGWTGERWGASLTAYRAADWINYDRLALARAAVGDCADADLVGGQLREYWRDYPGVTHLRAAFDRELRHGLTLTLAGDNLLDRQSGEPDDITVLPGRTLSLGLRAAF